MYVTFFFIRNRFVKLWSTRRTRELQNEKFLSTVGLKPTTSRLLDTLTNLATKPLWLCKHVYVNYIRNPTMFAKKYNQKLEL